MSGIEGVDHPSAMNLSHGMRATGDHFAASKTSVSQAVAELEQEFPSFMKQLQAFEAVVQRVQASLQPVMDGVAGVHSGLGVVPQAVMGSVQTALDQMLGEKSKEGELAQQNLQHSHQAARSLVELCEQSKTHATNLQQHLSGIGGNLDTLHGTLHAKAGLLENHANNMLAEAHRAARGLGDY